MKDVIKFIKYLLVCLLVFFFSAGVYSLITTLREGSLSNNIISIINLLILIVATYIFYRPLKSLFKPKDFSSKLILIAVAMIIFAFEFDGLSSIVKGIFSKENSVPKIWWVYIIILAVVIICLFIGARKTYSITKLDAMEGHEFEYACADILRANGYKNVEVTRGSGDFGVDVLAEKKGIKYAIQCKCYSHKLDNKPIQEVIGGLVCYGCTKGAVMTNQYFTEPAKELARINGVELWDRDVLKRMASYTTDVSDNSKKIDSKKSTQTKKDTKDVIDYSEFSDDIVWKAIVIVVENGSASTSFLQRRLRLSYTNAEKILNTIEKMGIVEPPNDIKPRKVNIRKEDLPDIFERYFSNGRKDYESLTAESACFDDDYKEEQKHEQEKNITLVFNKIDEFNEISTKYIEQASADIVAIYSLNGIGIEFNQDELLLATNEVVLEYKLSQGTRIADFKKCIKSIPENTSIKYAEYVYPTSTPQTVGIKIPLPQYFEDITTLMDKIDSSKV